MGIRTPHRRTAPAQADADVGAAPSPPFSPVPGFAPGASTARIPTDLIRTLRHTTAALRRRLALREPRDDADPRGTSRWRQWAELGRSYLALARTALPRARPVRTVTVFVASADAVSEPLDGSAPGRPRPHPNPNRQGPGRDATP